MTAGSHGIEGSFSEGLRTLLRGSMDASHGPEGSARRACRAWTRASPPPQPPHGHGCGIPDGEVSAFPQSGRHGEHAETERRIARVASAPPLWTAAEDARGRASSGGLRAYDGPWSES